MLAQFVVALSQLKNLIALFWVALSQLKNLIAQLAVMLFNFEILVAKFVILLFYFRKSFAEFALRLVDCFLSAQLCYSSDIVNVSAVVVSEAYVCQSVTCKGTCYLPGQYVVRDKNKLDLTEDETILCAVYKKSSIL